MKLLLALVAVALPLSAHSQTISGSATVIDGDSLSVSGITVRLFGIDAPEGKQTCDRGGQSWACGEEAATQLRELIGANPVECRGQAQDDYGRTLATCWARGLDLNKTMVEGGWAVAFEKYSDAYLREQARARNSGQGIWSSSFVLPQEYRAANRPPERATVDLAPRAKAHHAPSALINSGCAIKGNRNRKGQRIYHLFGMPYYDATRAEEIFCSEAEARAAGYRRAVVR